MAGDEQQVEETHAPAEPTGADIVPFPAPTDEPTPAAPLRDLIGDVLRDERTRQGRTLADVAEDAAVSLPYLSEVERGRKEVSSDVLDAIIGSLDLDLAEVLERAARRSRIGVQGLEMRGPTLLAA